MWFIGHFSFVKERLVSMFKAKDPPSSGRVVWVKTVEGWRRLSVQWLEQRFGPADEGSVHTQSLLTTWPPTSSTLPLSDCPTLAAGYSQQGIRCSIHRFVLLCNYTAPHTSQAVWFKMYWWRQSTKRFLNFSHQSLWQCKKSKKKKKKKDSVSVTCCSSPMRPGSWYPGGVWWQVVDGKACV